MYNLVQLSLQMFYRDWLNGVNDPRVKALKKRFEIVFILSVYESRLRAAPAPPKKYIVNTSRWRSALCLRSDRKNSKERHTFVTILCWNRELSSSNSAQRSSYICHFWLRQSFDQCHIGSTFSKRSFREKYKSFNFEQFNGFWHPFTLSFKLQNAVT